MRTKVSTGSKRHQRLSHKQKSKLKGEKHVKNAVKPVDDLTMQISSARPTPLPDLDAPELQEDEITQFREKQVRFADLIQATVAQEQAGQLDDKVVKVYTNIGKMLSTYRSGKIPKALKITSQMANWQQLVELTKPWTWTPQAFNEVIKSFVSNLQPASCEEFLLKYLLPMIRQDINQNKKLNYHYYQALQKSMFKPSAWLKGILLPLCQSCDFSLKEASIFGSIIMKSSIPQPHACAAIIKIIEMGYSGPSSYILQVLLKKQYKLGYIVIDAFTQYFQRYQHEEKRMPVLWHQLMLTLVEIYSGSISVEHKEKIIEVMAYQRHEQISDEVRKLLG